MWERYKEIYTDVWQLHKKHFGRPDWDSFVVEMQEIKKKHDSKFCEDLLIAVAEDLNKEEKEHDTRIKTKQKSV